MKKTILRFGLIGGAVCSLLMVATIPFENAIGFDRAEIVGYTLLVLSFLLVYFGVRSYRDRESGGQITFVKALGVGIGITLITCLFYVATWEILYFTVMHDFADKYAAHILAKAKASGASATAIQKQVQELNHFRELYNNPFVNAGMTFLEPFPVGVVISLLSAAVLRKRDGRTAVSSAAPAVL